MIIGKEELIKYLFTEDIIGCGSFGKVVKYDDDTLIKLYYKDVINTYYMKNPDLLDDEIGFMIPPKNDPYREEIEALEEKKFEILRDQGFFKDKVIYRNCKIGILLKYYKDYKQLSDVFPSLTIEQKKYVLEEISKKIRFYKSLDIYLCDIKENNIMVRPKDLDVVMIDLDDQYTRYETKEYIKEFPHIEKAVDREYEEMIMRLEKNY